LIKWQEIAEKDLYDYKIFTTGGKDSEGRPEIRFKEILKDRAEPRKYLWISGKKGSKTYFIIRA